MAFTAAEPLTEAKLLLNDPSGNIFPDEKLIPLMQKSYRELQTKMMLNGLPVLKEASIAIPVSQGTTFLGDGSGLPTDFIYPIELHERPSGSGDLFTPMDERAWEPDTKPAEALQVWVYREEQVKFLGATTNREVRIRYMKGLTRIVDGTSPIGIIQSVGFLASRTAAIAALLLGANPSRAQALDVDAQVNLADVLGILVKQQQGMGIRRRVNIYRR